MGDRMHLTLFIPDLLWPEPGDFSATAFTDRPALARLLDGGNFSRAAPQAAETALAGLFAYQGNAPYAALRLSGEENRYGGPSNAAADYWLCADPVHLRLHRERILLAAGTQLRLTDDEARTLTGDLDRELCSQGTQGDQENFCGPLIATAAERWYLRLRAPLDLPPDMPPVAPLSAVSGRSIARQLPEIPATAALRRWQSEVQMLLHQHPVNAARESRGLMTVNSLWLWGAGALSANGSREIPFDAVLSDDPLARGLALTALAAPDAGIAARALPADFSACGPACGSISAHQLIVLDQLSAPAQYEDFPAWNAALDKLERDWFAPLAGALEREVESVALYAPTVYGLLRWNLTRAAFRSFRRFRFFRRKPRPIASWVQQLAAEFPAHAMVSGNE